VVWEKTQRSTSKFKYCPQIAIQTSANPCPPSLWNVQQAIDTINQTYEIDQTNDAYNYRSHLLLTELGDQVEKYACSGGVWTQTTDVEGEVNGLLRRSGCEEQWDDGCVAAVRCAHAVELQW
jgi:hypothetical protein